MSADGGGTKQRFELYIKASAIDKETKGSCPICQHWFMITCLLGENQDDIDFKVYTVQADCPPKNFGVDQGWSKKFPVVMVLEGRDKKGQDLAGTKYDTFEELEIFFESINRECRELKRKNAPNVTAMHVVEDVYNAFNTSLNVGKPNKRLATALKKIDEFLKGEEYKFLVDNTLSFADCYLLPRLQHIRVAGKEYMDYDIPAEYVAIWKYLAEAYKTEAFRSTMPSDQDIVFHYEKKASNLMKGQKRRPRPTLQNFTYTLDVPEDIAIMLQDMAPGANGDMPEPPPPTEQMSTIDISPQVQDEVPQFSPEQAEASVDVYDAADHHDDVTDHSAAFDQAGTSEEAVTCEAAAVSQAEMEAEAMKTEEADAADEALTAVEAVVTHASPPAEDVGDTVTSDDDHSTQRDVTGDNNDAAGDQAVGGDIDAIVTANADVEGNDAVSDNVAEVDNSAADDVVGVRITVGGEEDSVTKTGVGNGDIIKEKDEIVPKEEDVQAYGDVATVDGSMQ